VTAGALSALSVVDASGAAVNLGGKMGEGKAILVMLRHLGYPPVALRYTISWSRANDRVSTAQGVRV
jgi:hypothetical protein